MTEYQVRPGDTLSEIALRFGRSVAEILSANPGLAPDRILVGSTIKIPKSAATDARRMATPQAPSPPSASEEDAIRLWLTSNGPNRHIKYVGECPADFSVSKGTNTACSKRLGGDASGSVYSVSIDVPTDVPGSLLLLKPQGAAWSVADTGTYCPDGTTGLGNPCKTPAWAIPYVGAPASPTARPPASPTASHAENPFAYCARVGHDSERHPGYTGPTDSEATGLTRAMKQAIDASGGPASFGSLSTVFWRCKDGSVMGCATVAAASPCFAHDLSREPSAGISSQCSSGGSLSQAFTRYSAYQWKCQGGRAVIVDPDAARAFDAEGYLLSTWYRLKQQ